MAPAEIVFGAASIATLSKEEIQKTLALLQKHNVKALDTASRYEGSEATLGAYDAPAKFEIHTKAPALANGSLRYQTMIDAMEKSLKDLGVESVHTYYLHTPDAATPIEETLEAVRKLYSEGKFKQFGLSNYPPAEVSKIHSIQLSHSSILPTLYQGNYNAVARHPQTTLFPLLRSLSISFAAYSPIAGGFLTKSASDLRAKIPTGRFDPATFMGGMYVSLYGKESLYKALEHWGEIAEKEGVSKAAVAYRWVVWHAGLDGERGDKVVIGARDVGQLEETLRAVEDGPLSERAVGRIEEIWEMVRGEAPTDEEMQGILGKATEKK